MIRQNLLPIILQVLVIILLICALAILTSCSRKVYQQTSVEQTDTVDISLVPVEAIKGVQLLPGQLLSIPSLDIELVRVSEKEVLVRTPVRTSVRTETTFVPVKNVDKSRTDNRTYTDSNNTDKSRTDSGNRTKQVDKDVSKSKEVSGFPWWIIILGVVLGILGWLAKRAGKIPFI